jgi:hypothetical protein
MKERNGSLYVAGRFGTANGTPVNNVARWDGTSWHALGNGLPPGQGGLYRAVHSLEFDAQGNLYAAGEFGDVSAGTTDTLFSIARWDGTRWTRLGKGVFLTPAIGLPRQGVVFAMAGGSEGLWLGGSFTHAGDKYSTNIALWENYTLSDIAEEDENHPRTPVLHQNYPNPFNPTTHIPFSVRSRAFVSLKVYDMLGREVRTLVNENLMPGSYEPILDASGLASGVYFYQLTTGSFAQTKKLLLLR